MNTPRRSEQLNKHLLDAGIISRVEYDRERLPLIDVEWLEAENITLTDTHGTSGPVRAPRI